MASAATTDRAVGNVGDAAGGTAHKASRSNDRAQPQDAGASSASSNISVTSPPYWMTTAHRQRNASSDSILPAGAITLQDNDTSEHDDRNNACWARSVDIVDHVVVNGGARSIGAFVVWNIRVETLSDGVGRSFSSLTGEFHEHP
ncbi:sorting nexin-like protein [Moelleriella libera RCEF 2490]|uniref:Sorting nexin-like protein n=1 Tax=Moelleriella libera RCEF 2490 TaxID=1081109 RepID=A0A167XL63_9HYPO|nr:sorting nexin-like protein [Moelleriella libera RCEF 2490]